jgi:arsenate reductase-like glutaredoxin family protein
MNANEMADLMEKYSVAGFHYPLCEEFKKAATMLRQQQAEIEALKLQLHTTLTNRDLRTYDGKTEINNEPLAYALRKAQEK